MAGLAALVAIFALLVDPGLSVREAHAIIGRPLTPMSYAGVARRTTRRAAVAGAYSHPVVVAPAPVVVAPPPVVVAPRPVYPGLVW